MERVHERIDLSEKAQRLIARLRAVVTAADSHPRDFDYVAYVAPLEDVLAEMFRAHIAGKITKSEADAVSIEARRIQRDFEARYRRAESGR
jgi:hypothetical protein